MGMGFRELSAALMLAAMLAPTARAQDTQDNKVILPPIDVSSSRLGTGIVGASTSVITSEDINRATTQSVTEILSELAGIQLQHIDAGVNGARDVVDMRGFGASATSNVLVLVNGRRFNDFDLQGFDFASIPLNSIERIEVTRGNSGAVLYGDGAVGGVINIVTKTGDKQPASARVEAAFGSFRYREGRASANASSGPWSAAFNGVSLGTDGYRENSKYRQKGMTGDLRYTADEGSVYFNLGLDDQKLGLPGGRRVTPTSSELDTNRTGAATPNDFANKQGQNFVLGVTRTLTPGTELIVDGSLRRKQQQAQLFFLGSPFNGVDTTVTTGSFTPRLKVDADTMGMPTKILTGFDYYHTAYLSNRAIDLVSTPYHIFNIKQTTAAVYGNGTLGIRPDTDLTAGVRYQRNTLSARDTYDGSAPLPFGSPDAQGQPLDRSEWQYAVQAGIEHRINPMFAVFGHVAHSFRVPNADERIGQAVAFNFPAPTPTNFDLRTQTSREVEGGIRVHVGAFDLKTSIYDMQLNDEIFYSPATGTNINLDPTRHYGVENAATLKLSDTVRLRGGLTYTRAVFREGPFAGNDIPLISKWTANAGVSWDIWNKWVVYDAIVRYSGQRRLDNDSLNVQPMIPSHAVVDMRIGGEVKNAFWSLSVQNVFNNLYYDYGIASTFSSGVFNAYPQPGRTYMVRAGATF